MGAMKLVNDLAELVRKLLEGDDVDCEAANKLLKKAKDAGWKDPTKYLEIEEADE